MPTESSGLYARYRSICCQERLPIFYRTFVTIWTLEEQCTIFNYLKAGLSKHGLARVMVEFILFGSTLSRRVMSNV
jgi:hypothetical protein